MAKISLCLSTLPYHLLSPPLLCAHLHSWRSYLRPLIPRITLHCRMVAPYTSHYSFPVSMPSSPRFATILSSCSRCFLTCYVPKANPGVEQVARYMLYSCVWLERSVRREIVSGPPTIRSTISLAEPDCARGISTCERNPKGSLVARLTCFPALSYSFALFLALLIVLSRLAVHLAIPPDYTPTPP
nr:hypothetical protein CFP56_00865 [Quercus suber]